MIEGMCVRATREMLRYVKNDHEHEQGNKVRAVIEKAVNDEESDWLAALINPGVFNLISEWSEWA